MLAICAAIQVLGHWYETSAGERVEGISLFDLTTAPQETRSIGELVTDPVLDGSPIRSADSRTTEAEPLSAPTRSRSAGPARRRQRVGDGTEGVVQGSVLGTYMHGPALARNPTSPTTCSNRPLGVETLTPLDLPQVDRLRTERLAAARRG